MSIKVKNLKTGLDAADVQAPPVTGSAPKVPLKKNFLSQNQHQK